MKKELNNVDMVELQQEHIINLEDGIKQLIKQVEMAEFTDENGHALKNNKAYIDLKKLVNKE